MHQMHAKSEMRSITQRIWPRGIHTCVNPLCLKKGKLGTSFSIHRRSTVYCRACKQSFSLFSGTQLEMGNLTVPDWDRAIDAFLCKRKNIFTVNEFSKVLKKESGGKFNKRTYVKILAILRISLSKILSEVILMPKRIPRQSILLIPSEDLKLGYHFFILKDVYQDVTQYRAPKRYITYASKCSNKPYTAEIMNEAIKKLTKQSSEYPPSIGKKENIDLNLIKRLKAIKVDYQKAKIAEGIVFEYCLIENKIDARKAKNSIWKYLLTKRSDRS